MGIWGCYSAELKSNVDKIPIDNQTELGKEIVTFLENNPNRLSVDEKMIKRFTSGGVCRGLMAKLIQDNLRKIELQKEIKDYNDQLALLEYEGNSKCNMELSMQNTKTQPELDFIGFSPTIKKFNENKDFRNIELEKQIYSTIKRIYKNQEDDYSSNTYKDIYGGLDFHSVSYYYKLHNSDFLSIFLDKNLIAILLYDLLKKSNNVHVSISDPSSNLGHACCICRDENGDILYYDPNNTSLFRINYGSSDFTNKEKLLANFIWDSSWSTIPFESKDDITPRLISFDNILLAKNYNPPYEFIHSEYLKDAILGLPEKEYMEIFLNNLSSG